MASRPILFEDWQQVPTKFKDWVANVDGISAWTPICNTQILAAAISNHSAWFNVLRDRSPVTGKKGIRDAMEHRGVRLLVSKQQHNDKEPFFTVHIDARAADVEKRQELLRLIPILMADFCKLLTCIHTSIDFGERYDWQDVLGLLGPNHDDVCGYWPEIGS